MFVVFGNAPWRFASLVCKIDRMRPAVTVITDQEDREITTIYVHHSGSLTHHGAFLRGMFGELMLCQKGLMDSSDELEISCAQDLAARLVALAKERLGGAARQGGVYVMAPGQRVSNCVRYSIAVPDSGPLWVKVTDHPSGTMLYDGPLCHLPMV